MVQKEDTSMSHKNSTGPTPVLASAIDWKTNAGLVPAVRLAGLRNTIYVGPADLPRLEEAVRVARARLDAMQDQPQAVAS